MPMTVSLSPSLIYFSSIPYETSSITVFASCHSVLNIFMSITKLVLPS